jgi:hypothetical protein
MKTSLFVIAAGLAIGTLIQSPSAQTVNAQTNPHQMMIEGSAVQNKSSPAAAAAAHWKADDAMAKALLLPPTEDVKKASAAMAQ